MAKQSPFFCSRHVHLLFMDGDDDDGFIIHTQRSLAPTWNGKEQKFDIEMYVETFPAEKKKEEKCVQNMECKKHENEPRCACVCEDYKKSENQGLGVLEFLQTMMQKYAFD